MPCHSDSLISGPTPQATVQLIIISAPTLGPPTLSLLAQRLQHTTRKPIICLRSPVVAGRLEELLQGHEQCSPLQLGVVGRPSLVRKTAWIVMLAPPRCERLEVTVPCTCC